MSNKSPNKCEYLDEHQGILKKLNSKPAQSRRFHSPKLKGLRVCPSGMAPLVAFPPRKPENAGHFRLYPLEAKY